MMSKKVEPITPHEKEIINKYKKLVNEIQTKILERANMIDMSLEGIITAELARKDREDFFKGSILDEGFLTFDDKIRLFEQILEKFHPKILKENTKMMKQLRHLRGLRNKFAHYLPNMDVDEYTVATKDQLHLQYFDKFTLKVVVYKISDLRKKIKEYEELLRFIVEFGKKITE